MLGVAGRADPAARRGEWRVVKNEGWTIALPSRDHRTPNACASCNGPRETSVVLQASKRSGNITTILRMKMPYCRACGARVAGAGLRMMLLFCLVTVLSIVLPGAAGLVDVGAAPLLVAIGGGALAFVLGVGAALVFLPKRPAPPATARGEAVTVTRFDDGGRLDLFCTNGDWAQRFASANQVSATPATRYRLVELIAMGWSFVLATAMVVMVGYAAEHPPARPAPAAAPSAPASPSAPAKSPARPPAAPTTKRK
jgi:hypothetical protein